MRLYPLALLLALTAACATQQPPVMDTSTAEAPVYASAISRSRAYLDSLMQRENMPGLSIAVMVDGQFVWTEGLGYADLEQGVPVTPETKMRIGSVAKPITSAGMALLVEAGRLDLDAPVQRYVPDFPEKEYPITTRQLAGHLAGIRHYWGDEFLSDRYYGTVDEGLEIFENDHILFEPGTRYSYSSYGWNLISAVMEGASEEAFLPYMKSSVFAPLNLRDTQPEFMDSLITNRSRYYVKDRNGRILNAPHVDNSYKWAGGGFISTARDVVRYGHAILTNALLQPETRDELFQSQQTSDGKETGYGLGWGSRTDDQGRRIVGHSGGSVGGTTQFIIYPDENLILCLISNLSNTRYGGAETRVAGFFLER